MTNDQKKELREHMTMRAFTFMLDDITKVEVLKKLRENGLDTQKGTISALIRVLLRQFAETDSPEWEEVVFQQVEEEYLFTTKKNKRSTM